jgi:hypothetical protein
MYRILLLFLLSSIHFSVLSQVHFNWGNLSEQKDHQSIYASTMDTEGNLYIAGKTLKDSVDVDPSSGVNFLDPNGSNYFFIRCNRKGEISFMYQPDFMIEDIKIDPAGYIVISGRYDGTPDMDFSPSVYTLPSSISYSNSFFAKYGLYGDFIFAKSLVYISGMDGGVSPEVNIGKNGTIFLAGSLYNTFDFDPGSAVFPLIPDSSNAQFYLAGYSADGDFKYASLFKSRNHNFNISLASDSRNNVYLTGNFEGTMDMDPGPGVLNLSATIPNNYENADVFFASYDSTGNIRFAHSFPGLYYDNGNGIQVDKNDFVYICGGVYSDVDLDPGPGVANVTGNGFLAQYDSSGNYIFSKSINALPDHMQLVNDTIYLAGLYFSSQDVDPGPAVYNLPYSGITGSDPVVWSDVFMIEYDLTGSFLSAASIGEKGPQYLSGLSVGGGLITVIGSSYYNDSLFVNYPSPRFLVNKVDSSTWNFFISNYSNVCYPATLIIKSDDYPICEGGSRAFASVNVNGTGLSYQWMKGGIPLSNDGHFDKVNSNYLFIKNAVMADTGWYFCRTEDGCGTSLVTGPFTLNVDTIPDFSAGPDETLCSGNGLALQGTITGKSTSLYWYSSGTGTFTPDAISLHTTYTPSLTDISLGSATITLVVNNSFCSNLTDDKVITISTCSGLSGTSPKDQALNVYPNPFNSQVTISLIGQDTELKLKLYNSKGMLLRSETVSAQEFQVDMEKYPAGIYLITIEDGQGRVVNKKIEKL